MSTPSTAFTRWAWPGAIIWTGVMLSAWVHTEKLSPDLKIELWKLVLLLLGVPALQLLCLLLLRKVLQPHEARSGDLLVLWLVTFLFGLHAAILATAIGLIASIGKAVPIAVALLMLGLAPVLGHLGYKSPLGIRTSATLSDPDAWRRAHRFATVCFFVAGLAAPLGLLVQGLDALYVSVAPAVFAMMAAIGRAAVMQPAPRTEDNDSPTRPNGDEPIETPPRVP